MERSSPWTATEPLSPPKTLRRPRSETLSSTATESGTGSVGTSSAAETGDPADSMSPPATVWYGPPPALSPSSGPALTGRMATGVRTPASSGSLDAEP